MKFSLVFKCCEIKKMFLFTAYCRSLPNWTDLKTSSQRTRLGGIKSLKTNVYMTSEEESPTQIQQRNIREAEMLTSNLGESGISQHEILSDIGVLKELAILQESMVYSYIFFIVFAQHFKYTKPKIVLGMVFGSNNRIC